MPDPLFCQLMLIVTALDAIAEFNQSAGAPLPAGQVGQATPTSEDEYRPDIVARKAWPRYRPILSID